VVRAVFEKIGAATASCGGLTAPRQSDPTGAI
jgi:hypothetical protein